MRLLPALSLLSLGLLSAAPALAGVMIGVEQDLVDPDKGEQPTLLVGFDEDYHRAQIKVKSEDGFSKEWNVAPVKPGQELRYTWSQKPGTVVYDVYVLMVTRQGERLEEETVVIVSSSPPITAKIPAESVDLEARTFLLHTNHPPERVKLEVLGTDLSSLGESDVKIEGAERGKPVQVTWTQDKEGQVFRVAAKVFDEFGYWAEVEIIPWSLEIPHEDVVFPTASHDLLPEEVPKLDAAWSEITKAVEKYGEWVQCSLFVGGYTDTVGDASSNQALSERRARTIAGYFQKKGADFPISFQGFGESVLAVQTADSVDEVRNRRATYIITAGGSPRGKDTPRANWTKLQ